MRRHATRRRLTSRTARALLALFVSALAAAALGCAGTVDKSPPEGDASSPDDDRRQTRIPDDKREAAEQTNKGKADWGVDICERNGWYGDKACDWFCPEKDPDCDLEPLGPEPSGSSTTYPIVLHHGFMGADTGIWSYRGVSKALSGDGHVVYETEVEPFHGVETRAETLARQVDEVLKQTGARKVNLVAHSMGGVDARYLVSGLGYGDRVASVTTIASPHRGTRVADAYLGLVPGLADSAADAVAELVGRQYSDAGDDADLRAAMEDLSTDGMAEFNADYPNDPDVFYQSWAGVSSVAGVRVDGVEEACDGKLLMHDGTMDHMDSPLWAAAAITAGGTDLELNDGMATPETAKWGEFRGCIPADHLDQVGQIGDAGMNEHTGFDHVRFYRNLAFDLAERGF